MHLQPIHYQVRQQRVNFYNEKAATMAEKDSRLDKKSNHVLEEILNKKPKWPPHFMHTSSVVISYERKKKRRKHLLDVPMRQVIYFFQLIILAHAHIMITICFASPFISFASYAFQ